ncbi:unnamed protein product [Anisakis simplex]|uniref:Defective in germ line development protein 3 (inferred by orthology to a C. elegans protein) n=1 Tax=Anisakis simplex TaxID=6269 RepID=A0A0M3J309_ANISI|nr:unnamed protein product [Anisakis simplex]
MKSKKLQHGWVCVVRGSLRWEDEIHDACVALRYLLFDTDDKKEHDPTSFYASQLDIPISQQLSVLGVRDAFLVRLVSNQTGALVCYPSPGNVTPEGQPVSMLYLRGPVKSILHARRYIQGLLPVQLFFDIEGCDLLERVDRAQRNITKRDDIFGVNITITASRIEGEQISEDDFMRHMVMIESGEFNLNNVYAFRHTLYRPGVLKEPTVITDQYNFFDPLVKELVFANNKVLFERTQHVFENYRANTIPSLIYFPVHPANVVPSNANWHQTAGRACAVPSIPLVQNNKPSGVYQLVNATTHCVCPIHTPGIVDRFLLLHPNETSFENDPTRFTNHKVISDSLLL